MEQKTVLRKHLVNLLSGKQAHANFEDVLEGFPVDVRGIAPPGASHSPWQVLEHMRIAQWDILEFSRDPKHVSPEFPVGYWPDGPIPPDPDSWDRSLAAFKVDLQAMQKLVSDPSVDLFAEIPWGTGQTVLREALLVADHNSYHLGEMVLLRRLLGVWPR
jgi:hypothetical protein